MTNIKKIKEAENILAQAILSRGESLTTKDLSDIVEQFRPVFASSYYNFSNDDFLHLVQLLESQYVTTMGIGVSLIDQETSHDEEWYVDRNIDWDYWGDYEKHLINGGWPIRVVRSMNKVTDKLLGLLNDPEKENEWYRKGLVIGHVQSGKTANYIGLLSKAADAGYKFIIVIAGIQNSLRKQTQERVDEGFIGRYSETKEINGVGLLRPKRDMPITVTTTDTDFNKALAERFNIDLKAFGSRPFILVIKKNVNTLSSLYNWLKKLNTREDLEKIADIPMLLIDDEADNASINTNKPELDPTRTNREIRNILNLFRKRCYVGYTATPFANIFIDPGSEDEMIGEELFPKDFIHCLDAPINYFGSEKIFLNEENSTDYISEIDDAESYIPLRHKNGDPVDGLPPTLKEAIRIFLIGRAIRNLRGQQNKHCSMMINVSRFVATQREIKLLVDIYLDEISKAIKFNYMLPVDKAENHPVIKRLKTDFSHEFSNSRITWEAVLRELNNAAQSVKTFLVNSRSDEALDFSLYDKNDEALTAIAIGGLSLSRGLTIEGLTVSYIYRNSKMYDTLMQMGRWFGYRDNYEDLCRVYMSEDSAGWYSHIAEATEELRVHIKRMRRERKSPKDFGLYVRAHPDTLIVTAVNKMRNAASRAFKVSYDGKLKETHVIPESKEKLDRNRVLLNSFYEKLKNDGHLQESHPTPLLFEKVNWETIQDFLIDYSFHSDQEALKNSLSEYTKQVSDLYPDWDVSFISLKQREVEEGYMIAAQVRDIGHDLNKKPKKPPPPAEPGWYVGNKQRFSDNKMFSIGLGEKALSKAQEFADMAGRQRPIYSDYTNARQKPLLMLHLLNLVDKKNNSKEILKHVPAIGVSFPNSGEFRTAEYIVNPIWLKQFEQDRDDTAGEEEDDDLY